jgi:hypothetical protein
LSVVQGENPGSGDQLLEYIFLVVVSGDNSISCSSRLATLISGIREIVRILLVFDFNTSGFGE